MRLATTSLTLLLLSPGFCPVLQGQEDENNTPRSGKLRVLYLEGTPRWEYRYLKNALVRDPSVEVQCFLASASRDFTQESSRGLPSLKAPPASEEELFRYDVVIVGQLSGSFLRQHARTLFARLPGFVRSHGGGVVALAGKDFRWTEELENVLPVEIDEKASFDTQEEAFSLRLTAPGRAASFLRLRDDPRQSRDLWEKRLPGFHGHFRGVAPKPGARTLAERQARGAGTSPRSTPVIVLSSSGKGRSLFVGVDQFWRWRAGVDNLYFWRFWKQALYHVAGKTAP